MKRFSRFVTVLFCLITIPHSAYAMESSIFVAHRGYCEFAPENTIESIASAGFYGFGAVEIDPKKTVDGKWILMHDQSIDRTTNGTGSVSKLTWGYIRKLIAKYRIGDNTRLHIAKRRIPFRIPTLESAIQQAAAKKMGVNIDGSKFPVTKENIEYITGLLKKYKIVNQSMISGWSVADRKIIHQYAPDLRIMWISDISHYVDDIQEACEYNYNTAIAYCSSTSFPDDVWAALRSIPVKIYIYHVSTAESAKEWVDKGVDYVETNNLAPVF